MEANGTQNQQAQQNQQGQNQTGNQAQNQQAQQGNAGAVDYQKIQQMLDGTLKAKEETALKAYFKQQA